MRGYYRQTKIVATVGPATESSERLRQLIASGVDVIRLNMAHGSGEWVAALVKRIRDVSQEIERHVADALAYLRRRDWCGDGTWLVVITNALAHGRVIDTIQLRQVQ